MFETLKKYLIEERNIDEATITMDATLVDDLGINSIDQAELVLFCEEKFNITVDDEEAQNFKTLGDIVRYLETAQQ
jgi:acyl carrier protein